MQLQGTGVRAGVATSTAMSSSAVLSDGIHFLTLRDAKPVTSIMVSAGLDYNYTVGVRLQFRPL